VSLTFLVVWRHGRTEWNASGRFQGQLDPPLDEVGAAQAMAAAKALTTLEPDLVVASDLQRAAATGMTLADAAGCPIRFDDRLRETSLGTWEGLTRAEVEQRYPEDYAAWTAGTLQRRGGGETREEVAQRMLPVVAELESETTEAGEPVDTAVIATHGGAALGLVGALVGLPREHWGALAVLGNCRWAELKRTRKGWRIAAYNAMAQQDLAELPPALDVEPPQVWT
jgi:probable phosphoglycerate mutase